MYFLIASTYYHVRLLTKRTYPQAKHHSAFKNKGTFIVKSKLPQYTEKIMKYKKYWVIKIP